MAGSPLSRADIDQLNLFRTWYINIIYKDGLLSNNDLINKLTEEVWDDFCKDYLIHVHNQQVQVSQGPQTPPRGTQAPKSAQPVPALKVFLRDYPITTGKASDWPRYRRKFMATATANGHEEVLSRSYEVPNQRSDSQGFARYKRLS